ncbi:MAG: chorismate synthase [Promethearchaeia archaeon]
MADNSFGTSFRITSFGESHGKVVGIVIDGVPAGLDVDRASLQSELNKRKPGQSTVTTSRKEEDKVEILSGIFKGKTTGAPVAMLIKNQDKDSSKYEKYKDLLRPSHIDYSALKKYKGYADYRGSGRFSGRITAGFVMAGAIAKQILKKYDISIFAYTQSIGPVEDKKGYDGENLDELKELREKNVVRAVNQEKAPEMIKIINQVKNQEDSIGGKVKCIVENFPPGIGGGVFNSLESIISKGIFSIPAVKGIEFGAGFEATKMKGSQHNDPWIIQNKTIKTSKNDAGGIIGGISIGMPITFRVAIKPTATIGKTQETVNFKEMKETEIQIEGRHDPCIVPRAIVVVEAMTAVVLLDRLLIDGYMPKVLE